MSIPLILASASPRRREMLSQYGWDFQVRPAAVDERELPGETPKEHVRRLAKTKALAVAASYTQALILAADTVVVIDNRILGKPRDAEEGAEMLNALSGRTHEVFTGFCLLAAPNKVLHGAAVRTEVDIKPLSAVEITGYLATGEPFDKAGAYAIQGRGAFMVRSIRGSYTNVVGLPLCEVVEALRDAGRELNW